VTASGNSLTKTAGCGGCADASAASEQTGTALQFTVSETGTLRYIGLGSGSVNAQPTDINFAWRLQGTTAEVREFGTYKTEIPFGTGDVLKITADAGGVRYLKNGALVYTSSSPAASSLRAQAVIYDVNATIQNIMLQTAASSTPAASTPPASTPPPSTPAAATADPTATVRRRRR